VPIDSEARALANLRREAKEAGAELQGDGEGGLPASLVLGCARRDGFQCKVHGGRGTGKGDDVERGCEGGLEPHHKGHLENPVSDHLRNMARENTLRNLVLVCRKAHDEIHSRDRAVGEAGNGAEKRPG